MCQKYGFSGAVRDVGLRYHPSSHTKTSLQSKFRQYPEEGHDWEHVDDYEIICSDIDSGGYVISYYAPILPTGVSDFDLCFGWRRLR